MCLWVGSDDRLIACLSVCLWVGADDRWCLICSCQTGCGVLLIDCVSECVSVGGVG